ncbi:E3 ubiquitin-protein ligase MIB2-like [Watersipora subatra]|uniref:E3 ubiquitin-protein ligase MIB2-like n=1 Tax=Watersipora subatra TaxID=2589382 RepID=UPI00355AD0B2
MATQSLSAQEQSSAQPASNPSISATVPPSNMMSSNSSPQQIAHNLTRMPTQTPAKPDITAQVKGQVAEVSSLSSSSVLVVSENTPPVLSSNVPSSSTERTTRHPDKEASVKIISRNSSEVAENVAEAARPAKDGKELSADVDIEQSVTDEQICSNDETLEPIQTQVSLQEEAAVAPSTPVLIKSKQFDERQFVNSVAASVDFTDIAASETSHKIYDREKRFLSTVTEEQKSKGTCHQQESAATGSSVTSYLPDAARNMSDCRDSHLNLASEYNDKDDQVGGAYADLGGATAAPPITESKSSIDEYLDNIDFKMDTKRASNSTHHLEFNMRRLLILSHVKIGDEPDTALHYSAYSNQPDILKLLLERGSNVNAVNEGGCSTLHVAVNNQHLDCVKVLIEHDCDVNIQDTYGDTPLHDAIGKESTEIVRLLMGHADVDFSLKNKRGFNALHHAALKGNCFAVEKTLFRAPKMVDVPKDDGFSSLHIASLNGHCSVVQALLKQGHANINLRNRRQQTPLMLACAQGHQAIVKILVESGASLTIADEEGHTALHHVLFRLRVDDMTSFNSSVADQAAISDMFREATQESAAIAKVLAENNADALQVNFQGQAPLDLVSDYGIKTELEKYCTFPLCIVCEEEDARVIFLPCKHRCTCNYCSKRMKKCLKCQAPIKKKLLNGAELTRDSPPYQAVKELNNVLQEMEGIHVCEICMDRKRNTVFACGHTACDKCAQSLNICHNCRKPITLRIPLYI